MDLPATAAFWRRLDGWHPSDEGMPAMAQRSFARRAADDGILNAVFQKKFRRLFSNLRFTDARTDEPWQFIEYRFCDVLNSSIIGKVTFVQRDSVVPAN